MALVDRLYVPREQDLLDLQVDIYKQKASQAALAVDIYLTWQIPADRVLLLQSVNFQLIPGAAQSAWHWYISSGIFQSNILPPLDPFGLAQSCQPRVDAIAGYPVATKWNGAVEFDDFIIPGGQCVCVRGEFNAAAANNQLVSGIRGYTIPRGNLSL